MVVFGSEGSTAEWVVCILTFAKSKIGVERPVSSKSLSSVWSRLESSISEFAFRIRSTKPAPFLALIDASKVLSRRGAVMDSSTLPSALLARYPSKIGWLLRYSSRNKRTLPCGISSLEKGSNAIKKHKWMDMLNRPTNLRTTWISSLGARKTFITSYWPWRRDAGLIVITFTKHFHLFISKVFIESCDRITIQFSQSRKISYDSEFVSRCTFALFRIPSILSCGWIISNVERLQLKTFVNAQASNPLLHPTAPHLW